jgi:hypothetical protein
MEHERLNFVRFNQAKIRAEVYQGVIDSLNAGKTFAAASRRRIVLPSSFTGGPRAILKDTKTPLPWCASMASQISSSR